MHVTYSIDVQSTLPREKLIQDGVEQLSTTELVALILGSGTTGIPIEKLAETVASHLREPHISFQSLRKIRGIGVAKACQLLAMLEFVERIRPRGFPVIDTLDAVLSTVSELRTAQREHIVCLYLNTRLQLLLKETVAIGSINQSAVSARDIFSVIKYHPVSFIIVAHNHPSGNPQPSPEDFSFTKTLTEAGRLLGVELLDHVIVAGKSHYSFKENSAM